MVGLIALIFCTFVTWQLFRLSREADVETSKALWIPTFWVFIAASRNVSAWLQYSSGGGSDQYLEGSPLDRAVLSAALALGVIVLLGRAQRVGMLLRSNFPILLYFLYCGISALWSDFPDVSFKRWFRALGDVVMVLIVLTDPNWPVALRRLLARVGNVVVPLSIVFIRYFPQLGRSYTTGGAGTWTGVGTDKNALGMISMAFGLASIFRFLELYREKKNARRTRPLIAQGAMIVMTFYLLYEAHSATALACFFLAGVPMVLTFLFQWARRQVIVHVMVFGALGVACSALFLNIGSGMVEELGRDTTLTGRTNIWHFALRMVQNPLLGSGFESFWVGPRLAEMERLIQQSVNQAHNGYIEVFLNLGWAGVALLSVLLITAYLRIASALRWGAPAASLRLAYFIVAVAYNFTEAAFKMMGLVWITFLLVMMAPEAPLQGYSPPLGLDQTDDLGESKQEATRVVVPAGRHLAHRVHREDRQRARKL
jgi:exopolysaccharide production protein ExoQ